jgi:hypothetical protein
MTCRHEETKKLWRSRCVVSSLSIATTARKGPRGETDRPIAATVDVFGGDEDFEFPKPV